ncbi:MAG: glycosyltransferase, partial [Clostridiales bacterium]|nr:glycosyltransferase [Clostridiales bacterium]
MKIIGSNSRNYPVRLLKVYWELLRTAARKYDIVFLGFAPQLVLPFWNFKFKKNKVIIDFFISMYDTFVNDRKKFPEKSADAKLLKNLDRNTLKKADRIICDTNAHGKYFHDDLGAAEDKLITMYLEADKSIYYPREVKRSKKLEGKFVVLYFGSVLPLQGVEVVLEAYNLLKEDDRFYFYMIGPVKDGYEKPKASNIEYIDWLPQNELADYIAMADLCLAGHFNGNIEKAKRTIPGKAYIYDAMEKPMVLGDNEANRELFSNEISTIYFAKMGDGNILFSEIKRIYDSFE